MFFSVKRERWDKRVGYLGEDYFNILLSWLREILWEYTCNEGSGQAIYVGEEYKGPEVEMCGLYKVFHS